MTTLHPTALQSDLEELARDLYESACCGSRDIWKEMTDPDLFKDDPELRKRFFQASHKGMHVAQDKILHQLKLTDDLTPSQRILFRGVADSIAWQLIGQQLCYARRLFKGRPQPNLKECNLESVVMAANTLIDKQPGSMALISDLTKFVQVGDLLTMGPTGEIGIVEVKEGEKNLSINEFLDFILKNPCERALFLFAQKEGTEGIKQLLRNLRQRTRMSHYSEVVSKGDSFDPDTKQRVRIPEDFLVVDMWWDKLNETLAESEIKGWAINVIDGCLFLGCYSGMPMKNAGYVAFNAWFDECGGTPACPRSLLLDSMRHPLALPIFNLDIPMESMFDVLFGRKQICMGINIEALLGECEKAGMRVRFGSNKEATRIDQTGNHPYRHKGKIVYIKKGGAEMALMDGIFIRALFHGQNPVQLISTILEVQDNRTA